MSMDVVLEVALVAVLVLVNAAFAGTELALVSLREGQLRRLERESPNGARLARVARDPNRFLATIQIGITLAGFLASAAAAVSLAGLLVDPLSFLGRAAHPTAVVVVTAVLSYVTLVVGELAPKRIAMQRAERWGLSVARPLDTLTTISAPIVWLLSASTDVVVGLAGGDPSRRREEMGEAELRELVVGRRAFTEKQRSIFESAFEIGHRTLREVVRPRTEVLAVAASAPCGEALGSMVAAGFSRAPVTSTTSTDDVVGVVHLADLVRGGDAAVGSVATDIPAFPESLSVLEALQQMQEGGGQLALVINEHGAVEGIVTVEDLVEELVGDIEDEPDAPSPAVAPRADGSVVLPGTYPVHQLAEIGVAPVPSGPYVTVAGLVLEQLGHVPRHPGEVVALGDWEIEVTDVGHRTIAEVVVRPRRDPPPQPSA